MRIADKDQIGKINFETNNYKNLKRQKKKDIKKYKDGYLKIMGSCEILKYAGDKI